jgi:hypothetical protein
MVVIFPVSIHEEQALTVGEALEASVRIAAE